jgi:hypothetical protein
MNLLTVKNDKLLLVNQQIRRWGEELIFSGREKERFFQPHEKQQMF